MVSLRIPCSLIFTVYDGSIVDVRVLVKTTLVLALRNNH